MTTLQPGVSRDLVAALGSVVMWWGRIEALLVNDVIGLNVRPDVKADKDCWPPRISTKKLIEQWEKCRRHKAGNDRSHSDTELRRQRLDKCAEIRNILVHGLWESQTTASGFHIVSSFKPVRGKPNSFHFERYTFGIEELNEFCRTLVLVEHDLETLVIGTHRSNQAQWTTDNKELAREYQAIWGSPPTPLPVVRLDHI